MPVDLEYKAEVNRFGGYNAFPDVKSVVKGKAVLKSFRLGTIKNPFGPTAVVTDGVGNVTDMPLLVRRPCFGRIEMYFRHASPKGPDRKNKLTGAMIPTLTRCGSCRVRAACRSLVRERVLTVPAIGLALVAWWKDSQSRHKGTNVYTGTESGARWTDVKMAIIEAGRFTNSNDAVLAAREAAEEMKSLIKRRNDRKRQRAMAAVRGLPDAEMLRELPAERNRRCLALQDAVNVDGASAALRRTTMEICEEIADIWRAQMTLVALRQPPSTARICQWLAANGLTHGRKPEALRQRVLKNVGSIRPGMEAMWKPFDPMEDKLLDANLALLAP